MPAYLLSALIPVGWVLADLFLLSKRFNFITAFLGLNAIVRGLLAFWFVDGALYALKDTGRQHPDRRGLWRLATRGAAPCWEPS